MKQHHLQAVKTFDCKKYGESNPMDSDSWTLDIELEIMNRFQSKTGTRQHKLFYLGNDNVHREEFGGKLLQRAYAYIIPLPIIISARPYQKAESLLVEYGDIIILENLGVILEVIDGGRWSDPKVKVLQSPKATKNHSKFIEEHNK